MYSNKSQNSKKILTTFANLFTAASLTSLLTEPIEVQFVTSNFPATDVGTLVLIFVAVKNEIYYLLCVICKAW